MKICMFHDTEQKVSAEIFGNKGSNLIKMYQAGVRVPYGFAISSDASIAYLKKGSFSSSEKKKIAGALQEMEGITGKRWGDSNRELTLSVRSGAALSMPGVLFTQLNVVRDKDMDSDKYSSVFRAIKQVWGSWDTPLAAQYRKRKNISYDLGTGVVIQEMRFGNENSQSGSGVVFTINPLTGEKGLYGEYLSGVQGDAIVSGSVNPTDIGQLRLENEAVYQKLLEQVALVEKIFEKPQDIEFTYENGEVYILQSRDVRLKM